MTRPHTCGSTSGYITSGVIPATPASSHKQYMPYPVSCTDPATSGITTYSIKLLRLKAMSAHRDIIHLNVGGTKMTTTKSTLCQIRGSYLASMFSEGQEDRLKRDENGYIFLDFNPQHFSLILDYLRSKVVETRTDPAPVPIVAFENLKSFYHLVRRVGLAAQFPEKAVQEIKASGAFSFRSEKMRIEGKSGATLRHDSTNGNAYALGKYVYTDGKIAWNMKLESYKTWLFIGIVRDDLQTISDTSFQAPGVYGWALGEKPSGSVYRDGDYESCYIGDYIGEGGDVNLTLNIDTSTLTLSPVLSRKVDGDDYLHLDVPESQSWRLLINMHDACSRIRML